MPEKALLFPGKRILVAEDNDLNMEIICTILEEYQIITEQAANGKEAVQCMEHSEPGRAVGAFPDIRCKPRRNKHYTEHLPGCQPVILAGILAGAFPFPDNVSGKVFQENIAEAAVDKTVKKIPVLVPIFEAVDHVGAVIVDSLQILLAVLFLIFLQNVFQMGRKHFLFGGEIPVKRHSGNACQLGKLRYGNGGQRLFFNQGEKGIYDFLTGLLVGCVF